MKTKRLAKSIKKFIRREKSRIRRGIDDVKNAKEMSELYQKFFGKKEKDIIVKK